MKCPKCGSELTEGNLYCANCGEEIRIVPDFEPMIENELNETLSSLMAQMPGEETESAGESRIPVADKTAQKRHTGRRLIIALVLVCLTIVLISTASVYIYRDQSIDYQIKKAKEYADGADYEQALNYLDKALLLEPENADILFLMADYYYLGKKSDQAVITLDKIINMEAPYEEDIENAYDKIIGIYKEENDYEAIIRLLENCEDENIVTMFQQFIAYPPEFSYDEGAYDEVVPLKLSANTAGKIYYTLDGSTPTKNSQVYTAPIFLETGNYTVSAFFVNEYDIKSDIVSKNYQINLMVPAAPEISVYSGDYAQPQMIVAEVPEECDVFYTSDGTIPSAGSLRYTAPIPMPLGRSIYQFIAISAEGVPSEITERIYTLSLNTEIGTEMAVNNIIHALMKEDVLLDEEGNLRAMNGRNVYKFHAAVRIGDGGDYYVINEYYEDAAGNQTKTERIYAVSTGDGSTYRVTYDEFSKITLIPF